MTSIKPRLNITHCGRKGDYHLVIQIIRHRHKREIDTPYRLYKDELCPCTNQIVVSKSHHRKAETISEINFYIIRVTMELESLAAELFLRKGNAYTAADLANAYRRRDDLTQFFVYGDSQVSKLSGEERDGTAAGYTASLRSLESFLGHRELSLSEFTSDLVDALATYLRGRGNKPNTVVCYLRSLRAIYNKALRQQVIRQDLKPFRNQSLTEEKTPKIAISAKELRLIAHADLSSCSFEEKLVRDLFMFSFHAHGMAFADMCRLRRANIEGDYLCYRRKKTDQFLRIFIEKPLHELLKQYADPHSEYLLPMLRPDDSYRARRNVQNKLNRCIRLLGVRLGLAAPLRFYVARHTWATLAREVGVDLSIISRGMGHTSEKTTRVYLAEMNTTQIDWANRRVMKLLI